MNNKEDWAVVGGGLLGMTMAYSLAKAGRRITLFESASQLGGLASAWQLGEIVWDRYYHVTLYSDTVLRTLLSELDLDQSMCWKKTKTGFYHDGTLFPFSTALDFARFPLLNPIEKARLGATIFRASRLQDWQQLESISVEEWLTRLSGKSVFEKIWLPLLRAKLGEDFQTTSATFIWATIQRMYAARQSGLKEERFGYLPGGYAHMLGAYEAKLRQLEVQVCLNAQIEQITPAQNGGLEVSLKSGSSQCFERVIVTTPTPITERICPTLSEDEHKALREIPYLGIICASALLKRPVSEYYITNILDRSLPFTGLIEMTALVDPSEFGNRSLLYIPHYIRPDHPDFNRSDEDLTAEIKSSLMRMHPQIKPEDFVAFRISRSRYVFPRPTTDASRKVLPFETSVPGLSLVNSAHIQNGTLNANETVGLAQREGKRLHAQN